MKTTLWKRPAIMGIALVIFIGLALICKFVIGTKIEHSKQYIFPCEGRIFAFSGGQSTISFYVLDEKKISELSDKNNIKSIALIDQNGARHMAEDWSIESAGFYQGTTYSAKKLNVILRIEQEIVVTSIEIKYPDTIESLDIGALTITPLEVDNISAATQILAIPDSISLERDIVNNNTTYSQNTPSVLYLSASSFKEGFTIKNIDLGITGLGVDPSTSKFVDKAMDFGKSFTDNSENKAYFLSDALNKLPNQEMDLFIESTKTDSVNLILAIKHDKSYSTEPTTKYFSPLYTCIDAASGKQFIYANSDYLCLTPNLVSDTYIASLLEEFGQ